MHLNVHSSFIYSSPDTEAAQVYINRWMDKEVVLCIYNPILALKKEWSSTICSNMDGPRDYRTKWSNWERERQLLHDITYLCVVVSCVWLFVTAWTVAHQAPLSLEFSRQECWSGLPLLSPGNFPKPWIKLRSPALLADSLPSDPPRKPHIQIRWC